MASLGDLLPWVGVQTSGAPEILLRSALLESAREFFRRSRGWRHFEDRLIELQVSGGYGEYMLPLASSVALAEVVELRGKPRDYLIDPSEFRKVGNRGLRVEEQDKADYLGGHFALMPVGYEADIPDFLFSEFEEPLVSGALVRLHRVPDGAWSRPDLVAYHREVFEYGVDSASTRAADGFISGRTRRVRYGGY